MGRINETRVIPYYCIIDHWSNVSGLLLYHKPSPRPFGRYGCGIEGKGYVARAKAQQKREKEVKLNRKYLIETVLEVISEGAVYAKHKFSSAKEMEEWVLNQIKEGNRKIKTGKGDFNFKEFAKVAEKLMAFPEKTDWVEFKSPENRLSQKPKEEEAKKLARKTLSDEEFWYSSGTVPKFWFYDPNAYIWETECASESKYGCVVMHGRWSLSYVDLKKLVAGWLPKFKRKFGSFGDRHLPTAKKMLGLNEAEDDDFYIQKFAGLLKAAPDIEHINSAMHHFEMLSPMMEPESVSKLSVLFLDRILGLYDGISFEDPFETPKEIKEFNQLRDQFLEIYHENSGGAKLPPEQFEKYAKSIVITSGNPGKDLLEIGYDFHSIFEKAFGFPPPRSKAFEMTGEELTLKATISGGTEEACREHAKFIYDNCIEYEDKFYEEMCREDSEKAYGHCIAEKPMSFEFWYDMQGGYIMEPWFRFETMSGHTGDVSINEFDVITIDDGPTFRGEEISKEKLPGALRSSLGIPWDADLPEWPELPKGTPPAKGSDVKAPVDPPYEGKRRLDKNYLFEMINEVLREEDEERELSEKQKMENMIRSNDGGTFVQGLEFCNVLACDEDVPEILNSQVASGKYRGYDWVLLVVKGKEEALTLHSYLRRLRPKSILRPQKSSHIRWWDASWNNPYTSHAFNLEHKEGEYFLEIVLDLPEYELTSWGAVKWLQEGLIHEEEDDEGKEKTPLELISSKLDGVLATKEWSHYVQFFDFIDTFEGSGLISDEEANDLRKPVWKSVFADKIRSEDNFNEIVEAFNSQPNLPEEVKKDIDHSIYYYGSFVMGEEWALNYVLKRFGAKLEVYDPDNLYEFSGVDQDTLEKVKEHLIALGEEEEHFEVYTETGGLMFGPLAKAYVNFEKKIEEIFGATPIGDPFLAGGSFQTVSISKSIDEPFKAPMVEKTVRGEVMFEWSPDDGYGLEITLTPIWKPGMPTPGDDYYGVWVSTSKEGPNVGELEIGIQNYEDEFADHKRVQNKKGTYGFTIEEMKEKVKELTGIDLDEIN